MSIAQSRLTAQGQISVPAAVRRKLGLTTGAVLEWDEVDGNVVVRRSGKHSSEDLHHALFPTKPVARSLEELKAGVRKHMQKQHARD